MVDDYNEIDNDEIDKAVERLINGDESARQDLIESSYQRLHRLARKMIKEFPTIRRWEQTDDVLQRVALRLWKSLGEVKPENSRHFFNLAALQVRRQLIELTRSLEGPLGLANNQDSVPLPTSETQQGQQPEHASDTYESSRLASWNEFHQRVEHLPDEEREVFCLMWYQGLSQESIASMLRVSQKTVSRRWQKARRDLYDLLDGHLPD